MKEESVGPAVVSGRFNTTHWSVILAAGRNHSPQSSAALEKLCRAYWHPLYGFIRRKGYSDEDAQDLTQQFFVRLLERNDFGAVDPGKGKFRTFLLAALTHFLANERDRAGALKRGGGRVLISLDDMEQEHVRYPATDSGLSPGESFDLRWATTVLDQALSRLHGEMRDSGKQHHFEALKKFLTTDAESGEYASIGQTLGMSGQAVAVAVHRLRGQYRDLVRAEVAETVSSPAELEEEMRYLQAVLGGSP